MSTATTAVKSEEVKTVQVKIAESRDTEKKQKREAMRQKLIESRLPTFEVAAREVHREHSKTFRNPKHAAQWITSLETYVFPMIGFRRVDTVEAADVLKVLSPIWLEKRETADRIKQRMKTVFDWCIASGHR